MKKAADVFKCKLNRNAAPVIERKALFRALLNVCATRRLRFFSADPAVRQT